MSAYPQEHFTTMVYAKCVCVCVCLGGGGRTGLRGIGKYRMGFANWNVATKLKHTHMN